MTWRLSRSTRLLRGDQFGLDWLSSLPWTSRSVWRGPGDQFAVDCVSSLVWETHQANPEYQDWVAWAKNQLDQMDAIKRAEDGEPLPGQDEPDRSDFEIAHDDYDDYED